MKAKYRGFCNACKKSIRVGSEIFRNNSSQSWIHISCYNKNKEAQRYRNTVGRPKKCGYCGKLIDSNNGSHEDFHDKCMVKMVEPKKIMRKDPKIIKKEKPDFKCEYCGKTKPGKEKGGDYRPSGKKFNNICKDCAKKINVRHTEPKNLHTRFDGR